MSEYTQAIIRRYLEGSVSASEARAGLANSPDKKSTCYNCFRQMPQSSLLTTNDEFPLCPICYVELGWGTQKVKLQEGI